MTVMNFDLEDGKPPVTFVLPHTDAERFVAFMAECQRIKESQQAVPALSVARNYETDIAHRLRLHATNLNLSQDLRDALTTGASEADRFYRGMVAWKATAEAKDRELAVPKIDVAVPQQEAQPDWIEDVIQAVAELPDRDSPPGFDMGMVVTAEELRDLIEEHMPKHAAVPADQGAPDTELRRAVKAITALLEDREWTEHISQDPDASALESAITELMGEANAATAQQVTCQPKEHFEWEEAQRICDLPTVDEAIRGFAEDQTGNNATCMVLAILEATLKATAHQVEQQCFSKSAETTPRQIRGIVLDSTAQMDAGLAKLRTAIDELVKRPSKARNKKSS